MKAKLGYISRGDPPGVPELGECRVGGERVASLVGQAGGVVLQPRVSTSHVQAHTGAATTWIKNKYIFGF